MLSVPLLIEKLYRNSVLPSFKKSPVLRRLHSTTLGRKLLNRLAGRKLRRAFGGRLYFFGIGGAALAPEVEDFLIEARFPYCVGYGLTETSPLIAGANSKGMRPRSTGWPIEGIEVKIVNPKPETGEGEIVVRGPIVMKGYYKDPERTAEVLEPDGWFHTGDLGIFDETGRLYIKGRVKNMILGPSGENIYPEAIESIINSFEFVEDSLVFQEGGEILARIHLNYEAMKEHMQNLADSAAGVPREVGELMTELRRNVNNRLSSFSRIGKVIEQKEPFEKTPTKKIKRFLYDKIADGSEEGGDGPTEDRQSGEPR
jgi:long-chain acyl-CoA synthetase